jgi:hypothetical protein
MFYDSVSFFTFLRIGAGRDLLIEIGKTEKHLVYYLGILLSQFVSA